MGETPLQHVLCIMNNKRETPDRRFDAAKAALPYCHPQLRSVEFAGHLTHGISRELSEFIAGNATATRSFLGFDEEDSDAETEAD